MNDRLPAGWRANMMLTEQQVPSTSAPTTQRRHENAITPPATIPPPATSLPPSTLLLLPNPAATSPSRPASQITAMPPDSVPRVQQRSNPFTVCTPFDVASVHPVFASRRWCRAPCGVGAGRAVTPVAEGWVWNSERVGGEGVGGKGGRAVGVGARL